MSGEAKVLTGLLERRALEEAFAELGHITDPALVQQRAQSIAAHGGAALQQLVSLLDTPDPQLRGGLGQVARQLPRDVVVPALRAVVRGHDRTDQARLAAVTVLERFLGEPVEDELIGGLRNPDQAARQSLDELIAEMDEEPLSVIEYLEQLTAQPPEVVGMVLDALPAAGPSPHLATLLRLLAQGEDARLAWRAVDELARLRTPAALRALSSLAFSVPPPLAAVVERNTRKLRFSGVSESADFAAEREPWFAPSLHWRLLMTPVDLSGGQLLWFIGCEDDGPHAVFFTVLVNSPGGLIGASGSLDEDADRVPPRRRVGAVHNVVGDDDGPGLTLLEAPLALGFVTLREALMRNWNGETAVPMGYRLFSPLICATRGSAEEDDFPSPPINPGLEQADLDSILHHPAFLGWLWDLDDEAASPELLASYSRRFAAMARWLAAAGDGRTARIAATVAYHLDNRTAEANSFLATARSTRQDQSDQTKENRNV